MRSVIGERTMRTHAAVFLIAALGLATLASGAGAQDVAAWRVECTGDGKTLDCRALQQLFQRDTRQLVLSVLVRKAPDPKAALLAIQLPLGPQSHRAGAAQGR